MGQQRQGSLAELCSNGRNRHHIPNLLLPQTTLHEQAQIIYSNTFGLYMGQPGHLALITLLNNEGSCESGHRPRLTYAQTRLSLCCLHTQSMDVVEDTWVFIGGYVIIIKKNLVLAHMYLNQLTKAGYIPFHK